MHFLNPIQLLLLLTVIHALYGKRLTGRRNRLLLGILGTCMVTEVITCYLGWRNIGNGLSMTLSIIVHHTLWLLLLFEAFGNKPAKVAVLAVFGCFALVNLLVIEGTARFNYTTFVLGALLYVAFFIRESFLQIKNEALSFLTSNGYLLVCAPLLFFLALSALFGFRSRDLTSFVVFRKMMLYDIVIYFVNLSYYLLINIYIFNEKRTRYA